MSFDEGLNTNPTLENKKNEENMNFSFDDNPGHNNSYEETQNRNFTYNNISFTENINEPQNVSFQENTRINTEIPDENKFHQENNLDKMNISFQANNVNNISLDKKVSQTNDEDNLCTKDTKIVNEEGREISEIVNTPQKQRKCDNEYVNNFTFGNSKYVCKADINELNENEIRNENLYFFGNINNISFEEPLDKNQSNNVNISFDENLKKNESTNDRSKLYKEMVNRTNISTDDSTIIYQTNLIKKNYVLTMIKFHLTNLERLIKINVNLNLSSSFGIIKSRAKELEKQFLKQLFIKRKISNSFDSIGTISNNKLFEEKQYFFNKLKETSDQKKIRELTELLNEKEKEIELLTKIIVNTDGIMKKLDEKLKEFQDSFKSFDAPKDSFEPFKKKSGTLTDIIYNTNTKRNIQLNDFVEDMKELIKAKDAFSYNCSIPNKFEVKNPRQQEFEYLKIKRMNQLSLNENDLISSERTKEISSVVSNFSTSLNMFKRGNSNQMNIMFIKSKNFL